MVIGYFSLILANFILSAGSAEMEENCPPLILGSALPFTLGWHLWARALQRAQRDSVERGWEEILLFLGVSGGVCQLSASVLSPSLPFTWPDDVSASWCHA